ncbi:MAG: YafY family transcriptional regulator [Treponema sp.]|nr:YafY family transcriptional regulator [Treponema sp.]
MQIDQLFELVYVLIDKKQVTAKEMAARFGVSTRTIYRWLDALSLAGIPVFALKGRGGGIAISENYALDKTVLSEEEKQEIVSSVKAFRSLSGISGSSVGFSGSDSLTNMQASFRVPEKISHLANQQTDWLQVDFAPWSPEGQGVRALFSVLRDSILKKRQLEFDYFSGNGKFERRTVHPWKLVYRGQAWYLFGWCALRKSARYFKLSRIQNVVQTMRLADVTVESNGTEVFSEASDPNFGALQRKPELLQIKAEVSAKTAFYFLDTFACSSFEHNTDGTFTAIFTAPDEPWLPSFLLSFGTGVRILSPDEIVFRVSQMAKNVAELYK